MKSTPTPEMIDAAERAIDALDYATMPVGDIHREIARAALSAALSVPAAAVVGEPEPIGYCSEYGLDKLASKAHGYCLSVSKAQENEFQFPIYAAPSAPEGWQPIDSAPHGVPVLLATPPFKSMGEQAAWELRVGAASWGERIGGISNISRDAWATHWKPLPSPPTGGDSHE